jgi:hypothetical protein
MWLSKRIEEGLSMKILSYSILVGLLFLSCHAWAEDSYDGTKQLLCASVEAIRCETGEPCEKGLPEEFGAPQFMTVDFAKKEIIGPKRTTAIRLMEKTDEQITLQGFELGMGWTFALDRATGKMAVTLMGREAAFVVFGACTPFP